MNNMQTAIWFVVLMCLVVLGAIYWKLTDIQILLIQIANK